MGKHLSYANYIVRHKYFVLLAGLKTKASLRRLLIHDWSKMLPAEWGPYATYFYQSAGSLAGLEQITAAFDRAWLRHIHRNDHHWQHWVLREDSGVTKCLEIPDAALREMVADWMGAGRAIRGRWEAYKWYIANEHNMQLHPASRIRIRKLLSEMHYLGMA